MRFFQHQYQKKVHEWYFMIGFTCNISLDKIRSKVQEKNMSCERALNFDQ